MAVLTAIFLVTALVLSVVIGPQTRPWPWGPAMLILGAAAISAIPGFWKRSGRQADFGLLGFGSLVVAWFAWRAWNSPVAELGQADLMLLAGVTGSFVAVRSMQESALAGKILGWGVALLLLANIGAVALQVADPLFSPVFRTRANAFPSGFYAHYNEAANFLIAASLLVGAGALFGQHGRGVRMVWGLIALAGMAAVVATHSRGGILGAAVGAGVFSCAALAIGKRTGARWFPFALVAIPLVAVTLGIFLLSGWKASQEARSASVSVEQVLDSNYRLYFMGLALSCIGLHPLAGGGARSFSWESFQFYDLSVQGIAITRRAEQVHNELLQAATDYGIIGAGLLAVLLAVFSILAVVRLMFSESSREFRPSDAWCVGGLAALAGMFVQSSFSFVFHLMPGAILLGICLGKMSRSAETGGEAKAGVIGTRVILSLAALLSASVLIPAGWKGSAVTRILWTSYFGKGPSLSPEAKIDALTEAIERWPQSELLTDRASIYQESTSEEAGVISGDSVEHAISDYRAAFQLHPFDPGIAINLGNLLSYKQRDQEAEAAYATGIQLEGGMEPAFQGHFLLATHLLRKGHRVFSTADPSAALEALEEAARQVEQSVEQMRWASPNIVEERVAIHENLGAAREASGDYPGAMEAYNFASKLLGGNRANYRAGLLEGKLAAAAWSARRPAEGLAHFIEARRRIDMASELPKEVQPSQRTEYLDYLDRAIAYLKGAKIEPAALPESPR